MTRCPTCQTDNQPGARFCKRCGAPLSQKSLKTMTLPPSDLPTPPAPPQPRPGAPTQRLSQPGATRLAAGELLLQDRYEVVACIDQTPARNSYVVQERVARPCPKCRQDNDHDAGFCDHCGTRLPPQPRGLMVEYFAQETVAGALAVVQARFSHPAFIALLGCFRHGLSANHERFYVLKEPVLSGGHQPGFHIARRLFDESALTVDRALALAAQIAPALDALVDAGLALPDLAASQFLLVNDAQATAESDRLQIDALETVQPFAVHQRAQAVARHARLLARLVAELARGQELAPPLAALLNDVARQEQAGSAVAFASLLDAALRPPPVAGPWSVVVGKLTDLGRMREINEDSILTLEVDQFHNSTNSPLRLYALADGMGGHAAGEVASKLALNQLSRALLDAAQATVIQSEQPPRFDYTALLKQAGQAAARAVNEQARRTRSDLGTTLVAALVDVAGRKVHVINVGDSRLYKINAGGIRQVTKDHSMVQLLLDKGQITPEQARSHPNANLIYRTLGEKANVEIDTFEERLAVGDALLLCSDGLSGLVNDDQLCSVALAGPTPQAACARLVELANQAGGHDNISVIIVQVAPS